jgi:hypothetical protein
MALCLAVGPKVLEHRPWSAVDPGTPVVPIWLCYVLAFVDSAQNLSPPVVSQLFWKAHGLLAFAI